MTALFPTFTSIWERAKRILCTDVTHITPAMRSISNELAAIYEPQLVPVRIDGVTVEWVDSRTGKRPLFS